MSNSTERMGVVDPPPSYVYDIIGTVMFLLLVFASLENALVILAFLRNRKLRTKTNTWIFALMVCDLLIVSNAFPLLIIASFAHYYVLGVPGCNWDGFIVTALGTSSIYLLAGLSLHRYFIMFGEKQDMQSTSKMYVFIGVFACFMLGVAIGVLPLIGWGTFELEGIGISCAPNWRSKEVLDISFTAFMYLFVLLLPLLMIGYCYVKIILKVWREKRNASTWLQERRVVKEIRVTVSVALTILSFLISWTPYAIICACESFFSTDFYSTSPLIIQLPCLMAKSACIWNPIVYVYRNTDFRKAVLRQLPSRLYNSEDETRGSSSSLVGKTGITLKEKRPLKDQNEVLHNVSTSGAGSLSRDDSTC